MRKRMLGKIALALMVAAQVQTAAIGVEAADHIHTYDLIEYSKSYSYKDEDFHSRVTRSVYRCLDCGNTYTSTVEDTESHYISQERVWYYNEWCIRTYCTQCGHQFSIGPED